jgi:hypothetical protein
MRIEPFVILRRGSPATPEAINAGFGAFIWQHQKSAAARFWNDDEVHGAVKIKVLR